MRVNARLDDESREQIEYLTAATCMGVSHVLRESVVLSCAAGSSRAVVVGRGSRFDTGRMFA